MRELKIRASAIVRAVRERRARYVITYRGRAVAILAPLETPPEDQSLGDDQAVWDELIRLGREIGKRGRGRLSTVDLLSKMRR